MDERFLLHGGLAAYGAGTLAALCALLVAPRAIWAARLLAVVGAATHGIYLAELGLSEGVFPIRTTSGFLILFVAAVVLLAVATDTLRRMPILSLSAAPIGLAAVASAFAFRSAPGTPEVVPTGSFWTGLHVATMLLSYAAFALAFLAGVLYLLARSELKRHEPAPWIDRLPSLEGSARVARVGTWAGLLLLTAGILIGYLYMRSVGKEFDPAWRTDPKVLLTTGTWACYVVVSVLQLLPGTRGRAAAMAAVVGFLLVVFSLWCSVAWSDFHRFA